MNTFIDFLNESILLEGGKALKGTSEISQSDARKLIPRIIDKIALALNLEKNKVKSIGSAGNKPLDSDLSGDIDIAIECTLEEAESVANKLAYDGKTFRIMKGINVVSFAEKLNDQLVQIDLMPVQDIKFAVWSMQAHELDLKAGLKGAHRNELFFALAKNAKMIEKTIDEDGKPLEIERLFYDLNKGLMSGEQSRVGKKKNLSGFKTTSKQLITSNPQEICKMLFGAKCTPLDVSTFKGTLEAIKSKSFLYPNKRDAIIEMAAKGIAAKGLKDPF